ncbi:MAG TPA: cupin domain-containing protein [Candidatus Competibacteraceae bacterium]|nr:cupin domain-containing protein [Candidatus Competibacteraceae bacterium]
MTDPTSSPLTVTSGAHYACAQCGPLERLYDYYFEHPALARPVPGKLFLGDVLGLSAMEVSLNRLPAKAAVPFYHRHRRHEELYIFLRGRGQFQVDGAVLEVREGTVIRVDPAGERTWRNLCDEDLYYIVIQAAAGSLGSHGIDDGELVPRPVEWPADGGREWSR